MVSDTTHAYEHVRVREARLTRPSLALQAIKKLHAGKPSSSKNTPKNPVVSTELPWKCLTYYSAGSTAVSMETCSCVIQIQDGNVPQAALFSLAQTRL
jgi:hypothetical protein